MDRRKPRDDRIVHNRKFVAERGYEPYKTSKYPDKKLAILTCMDTRLTELLPAALGIPKEHIDIIRKSGVSLEKWLGGFESAEEAVKESVESLNNHPLMPKDIVIRGFMMDSLTGELSAIL